MGCRAHLCRHPVQEGDGLSAPDLEEEFLAGAIAALRRRADRQRDIAKSWTAHGERGAVIRQGEAAIALRIAGALDQAADDLEAEAKA
jgi:hypothetical protein